SQLGQHPLLLAQHHPGDAENHRDGGQESKLGQTLARPALVCWVARIASSTRRPTTTSAATPIPETTSSAVMVISSRRPARQGIAGPPPTSRSISRPDRPSGEAFIS